MFRHVNWLFILKVQFGLALKMARDTKHIFNRIVSVVYDRKTYGYRQARTPASLPRTSMRRLPKTIHTRFCMSLRSVKSIGNSYLVFRTLRDRQSLSGTK